jgi:hypothetical protein
MRSFMTALVHVFDDPYHADDIEHLEPRPELDVLAETFRRAWGRPVWRRAELSRLEDGEIRGDLFGLEAGAFHGEHRGVGKVLGEASISVVAEGFVDDLAVEPVAGGGHEVPPVRLKHDRPSPHTSRTIPRLRDATRGGHSVALGNRESIVGCLVGWGVWLVGICGSSVWTAERLTWRARDVDARRTCRDPPTVLSLGTMSHSFRIPLDPGLQGV